MISVHQLEPGSESLALPSRAGIARARQTSQSRAHPLSPMVMKLEGENVPLHPRFQRPLIRTVVVHNCLSQSRLDTRARGYWA